MKATTALLLLAVLAPNAAAQTWELRGGSWFDGRTFQARSVTWVVDGRFTATRPARVDSVLEVAGKFVIPPYADAHNHYLSDGMDYGAQTRAAFDAGIFHMKNPNNTRARTQDALRWVNRPEGIDVADSHGGIPSPGGHPAQSDSAIVSLASIFSMT